MDAFLLMSLMTFVILGISLCVTSLLYKRKKTGEATLPPGQEGWPFIGETLDFLRFGQSGNPEKFITDRMTKFSPKVFMTSLMGENMVTSLMGENMAVFCGPSGNKCLFTSDNKYVTPWSPDTLTKVLVSPENIHLGMKNFSREGRKVTNEFLKPEVLHKKFVRVMDYVSKQHIAKNWAPNQHQVLVFDLAKKYTFGLACRLFLSLEDPNGVARLEGLFTGITTGIVTMPVNFPGTPFNRAIKSARVFRKEVVAIIKRRKLDILEKRADMATSKDMLSHMLLSTYDQDGEFPSDMVVADMVLGFLIDGHDTASAVITFMIKYLSELPNVYAEVLKERLEIASNKKPGELLNWEDIQKMKYSWSVAYETMRIAPPAQGTFREAITDFTYAGFTISKGWKTYWTVHSTNKNPEYFKNPEEFDPTRFEGSGPAPFTFVPFGGGTHICPGREYARVEILVCLNFCDEAMREVLF